MWPPLSGGCTHWLSGIGLNSKDIILMEADGATEERRRSHHAIFDVGYHAGVHLISVLVFDLH